jgi:adenylate cyclase class 2
MLEVEIKAYADNHEAVRRRLAGMGCRLARSVMESDTYFNHPSRDFARTDEALRIRREGAVSILTYKGPKLSSRAKTRFEVETEVGDAGASREILLSLGFTEVAVVSKRRDVFMYGDIEICIDEVEGVGNFIELEKRSDDREKAERELFELASTLGLSRFERRSYLELKLEKN